MLAAGGEHRTCTLNAMELKVVGGVELEMRDELSLDGQLRLARGHIEVQGRTFRIERGDVTFQPDRAPSNPTVVATGVCTAPEGTRVYAEFVGPVETGELTLRSEPPLRDDQILSLLLFGSTDGSFGSATGGEGTTDPLGSVGGAALVAGGNVVARGLTELRRLARHPDAHRLARGRAAAGRGRAAHAA